MASTQSNHETASHAATRMLSHQLHHANSFMNLSPEQVESNRAEIFIASMIVLNAIQIGASIQFDKGAIVGLWVVFEHLFTAVFFLEMILKIKAMGRSYFKASMNCFDGLLVCLAVLDNWIFALAFGEGQMKRINVLRIVRPLFKLARIARILKVVRLQKDIMMFVSGIVASAKCMLPIACLLFLSIYTMSIACVDAIGHDDWGSEFDNQELFGSLPASWLTLLNIVMLAEWSDVIRPMAAVKPEYVPFFIAFVFLNAFGLMNVIIGVICENTQEVSHAARKEKEHERRDEKMRHVQDIALIIDDLDTDNDGRISEEEFENSTIKGVLNELLLPHGFTPQELHEMLDMDGDGDVTVGEFITSMFRLVHSNDFQNNCLTNLHFNQLKKAMEANRQRITDVASDLSKIARGVDALLEQAGVSLLGVMATTPPSRSASSLATSLPTGPEQPLYRASHEITGDSPDSIAAMQLQKRLEEIHEIVLDTLRGRSAIVQLQGGPEKAEDGSVVATLRPRQWLEELERFLDTGCVPHVLEDRQCARQDEENGECGERLPSKWRLEGETKCPPPSGRRSGGVSI